MIINIFSTCALTGTQEIGQRTDYFTDRLNLSAKDSILSFFLSLLPTVMSNSSAFPMTVFNDISLLSMIYAFKQVCKK